MRRRRNVSRLDLVVIGSGPGGYRAAVLAAQRGLSVAIVERDAWGGACLNRGCVPKKAWYHTARILAAAPGLARRGVRAALQPDFAAAWQHQRDVVVAVRASYEDYLDRLGVQRFEGAARFTSASQVVVNDTSLDARHFVIATGSRPRLPEALSHAGRGVLNTDDLFERPPPPGTRVALLGSGAVGVEMAFILTRLGLNVLWLTGNEPLSASRFSVPARKRLTEALAAQGVAARTRSRPLGCEALEHGIVLRLPDGAREQVDWVLAGTGRRPNTDDLALEAAGVRISAQGFIVVDEAQRSTARNIFAIGDCANPAMTSNHALAEATVAVANLASGAQVPSRRQWVPEVIYSALELARAGATEDELEHADTEYAVGFSAFASNPAALAAGEGEGYVRLLANADQGTLLGCEIVGAEAGELIHFAQPGAAGEALLARLARERFTHPSRSEEFLNAAEALVGRWGMPIPAA